MLGIMGIFVLVHECWRYWEEIRRELLQNLKPMLSVDVEE
jgi:hypothetical protein